MKKDCTECAGYFKCSPDKIKKCIRHNYSCFELKSDNRKGDRRGKDDRRIKDTEWLKSRRKTVDTMEFLKGDL